MQTCSTSCAIISPSPRASGSRQHHSTIGSQQQLRQRHLQHRKPCLSGCGKWQSSGLHLRSPTGCRQVRQGVIAAANSESDREAPANQSYGEGGVLLRLGAVSVIGAAVVKYGELLLGDVPFSHNLPLALTMIVGPCVLYSAWFAIKSAAPANK
mmetsp:Transcript_6306/g.18089  ORF Transcript_6306/g.18089 Transcript_6306/m.18089 type:complete len:154 (+) Transcript_6306:142-603(+)